MSGRVPLIVLAVAATAGLFFASFSTFDFVQHLDRQVHDIHCSFVPGLVEQSEGAEGCAVTMMSPYSSLFRKAVWGGIPISLAAMSVFAFILFRSFDLMGREPEEQPAGADVLLAATLIPVVASGIMGWIAYSELQAACKLCIGIYASSAGVFLAAVVGRRVLLKAFVASGKGRVPGAGQWMTGIAQLGIFVSLPILGYVVIAPDNDSFIGSCGALEEPADPYGVMIDMGGPANAVEAIEVFDPLCPACRAFEERLEAAGLDQRIKRRAVMFPLDAECNWMVSSSMHPGACAVSEAVLCAAENDAVGAQAVIDWAFANQDQIIAATKADPGAAASMVAAQFSALDGCLGSAETKQRLNKSLRWTVTNRLPVLTPQLYVDGVKLCDEDTDLGLDWALTRMLKLHEAGELIERTVPQDPVEAPEKPKKKRRRAKPAAQPTPEPSPKPASEGGEPSPAPEPVAPEPVALEPGPAEEEKAEPAADEDKAAPAPEPNPPEPAPAKEEKKPDEPVAGEGGAP